MKRISAPDTQVGKIERILKRIESLEEHDKNKIEKSIQRMEKRGGIAFEREGKFGIKKFHQFIAGTPSKLEIGNTEFDMEECIYIVGRAPEETELIYYEAKSGDISEKDAQTQVNPVISRFDLIIIPNGDVIEIFNIGKNEAEIELDRTAKF